MSLRIFLIEIGPVYRFYDHRQSAANSLQPYESNQRLRRRKVPIRVSQGATTRRDDGWG